MFEIIQLSVSALAMGFIYALAALSISLIYNAGGVVNFCQGALVMLGSYVGVTTLNHLSLPYPLAIVLMMIIMGLIGLIFQRFVYYPLRYADRLMFIIAGIGITVFLENFVQILWGPAPIAVRPLLSIQTLEIGEIYLEPQSVAIVVVTGGILFLENFFLRKTILGKMTQAVAQDKDAASLMGVSVGLMIGITFVNSTILAGITGVFISPIFYVSVGISSILLKAFSACVVGGFGNAAGAIVGGVIVGFAETFGARFLSPQFRDAWAFVLLIFFLLVRPQGIFPEKIAEKV
ncbi:MAG: branched-chain amino acid ABC transporter permease [Spirochaetia bacterium]|jgi:branched-chain amino acid transport system permease protein|nr:branched-chain amino acid ABC transporter permease [Spirochaetia bacterium]